MGGQFGNDYFIEMLKKIASQSIIYSFANYLPLLANIVLLPFITPFLTKNDYGIFGLTFAYIGLIEGFSNLGLITLLQNSYYKDFKNFRKTWSKFLGILIIWKVFYSTVCFIILYIFFSDLINGSFSAYSFLVIFPILFFDTTNSFGIKLCQYEDKHNYVYNSNFIAGTISIISTFISIYFLRLGFYGFLISKFLSSLSQFCFFSYYLHSKNRIIPNFNFSTSFIKSSLKISLPLIPHYYASFFNTVDKILLNHFGISVNQIGGYTISKGFSDYFGSFNNTLNTILSPLNFRLFKKNGANIIDNITTIVITWFSFSLTLVLLICLWVEEIFSFLYNNPDFKDIYLFVPFLIVGMLYRPFYVVCVDKLIFLEKTKFVTTISLSAASLSVVLNIIMIPFLGFEAVLYTYFISQIFMGFIGFFIPSIKKHILFKYSPILFLFIIISCLFIAILFQTMEVNIKIILSVFIICTFIYFIYFKMKSKIQLASEYLKNVDK